MKLIITLHARCAGVLFYWRWTTGSSALTRDRLTVTLLIRNTSLEYLSLIYIPRSTNMRSVCPDLDIVNDMDNDKISEFTCIRFGSVAKLKCKNFVLKVVISKHIHCGWNHDKVFTTKLLLTLTRKQTLNIGQHLSKIMNVCWHVFLTRGLSSHPHGRRTPPETNLLLPGERPSTPPQGSTCFDDQLARPLHAN